MRYLAGSPGQAPPRFGLSLGDSLAAMCVFQGILMALYWRDTCGGQGQVVDASLVEACFSMLESVVPEYAATGAIREPTGTKLPGIAPSNLYPTADGKWVVIAANQDTVFSRLAHAMGRIELASDPRFATHEARGRNQEEIDAIVARWSGEQHSDGVLEILEAAGVPVGSVYSVAEIFQDQLFRERSMLLSVEDDRLGEIVMPGVVPKLSLTQGEVRWPGQLRPGVHNKEVFGDILGLDPGTMAGLAMEGVL